MHAGFVGAPGTTPLVMHSSRKVPWCETESLPLGREGLAHPTAKPETAIARSARPAGLASSLPVKQAPTPSVEGAAEQKINAVAAAANSQKTACAGAAQRPST